MLTGDRCIFTARRVGERQLVSPWRLRSSILDQQA